jgi:phosphohistidine phosphatase SixA
MPPMSLLARRARVSAIIVLLALWLTPDAAWAQKAVFVVRHAERLDSSEDSPLSPAGKVRAEALARHLRSAGISSIFVSNRQRTAQTAAPLAAALEIKPTTVPADATKQLVGLVKGVPPSAAVLVVGHSNTVPEILKMLGHPSLVTIADNEFDALFVLVPRGRATPALLRLAY